MVNISSDLGAMRLHSEVELTTNQSAGWVCDTRRSKGLSEAQGSDLLITSQHRTCSRNMNVRCHCWCSTAQSL